MRDKGKKRVLTIGAFDLAKGIGVLCIVAGHTIFNYNAPLTLINSILRVFGLGLMPMFFLLSGFGCKGMSERKYLKKTAKELLLPYLYVTIAVAILFPIIHFLAFHWWPGTWSETIRIVLAYLTGCAKSGRVIWNIELYECSVVWYFLALFWASNILNLILKRTTGKHQLMFVCICIAIGAACIVADFWYWCIPQGFLAVGYLYLGYRLKKSGWLEKKLTTWQFLMLIVATFFEIIWGNVNFAYGIFKWGLLDYLCAGLAGVLMIRVSLLFNRYSGSVLEIIRKIGRFAYYAICIHSVEMSCIPWYLFSNNFISWPYVGFMLQILARGGIIFVVCAALNRILMKKRRRRLSIAR